MWIALQLLQADGSSAFNLASLCLCLAYALYVLLMLGVYFSVAFKLGISEFENRIYFLPLFHKFPFFKSRLARNYSTPCIVYKLAFVFLLYYDLKITLMVASFLNPVSMILMDIWQFVSLNRNFRLSPDWLYMILHFWCDLLLLFNGFFMILLQRASYLSKDDGPPEIYSKLDFYYSIYRAFLICFLIQKFCLLLLEIKINQARSKSIRQSIEFSYYMDTLRKIYSNLTEK